MTLCRIANGRMEFPTNYVSLLVEHIDYFIAWVSLLGSMAGEFDLDVDLLSWTAHIHRAQHFLIACIRNIIEAATRITW